MDQVMTLVAYVQAHQGMIFGILFGLSEILALVPGVQANSVFQAIFNFLKSKKPAA